MRVRNATSSKVGVQSKIRGGEKLLKTKLPVPRDVARWGGQHKRNGVVEFSVLEQDRYGLAEVDPTKIVHVPPRRSFARGLGGVTVPQDFWTQKLKI